MFTTRRVVAVFGSLALAIGAPSVALASHGDHGKGHGHGHHGNGNGNGHGNGHHGNGNGKGHNKDAFTAVGTVTAVDGEGGTITLADKGGTRALHGTTVTVTVPSDARVIVDDSDATLSDVVVGDHAVVKGSDVDDTFTAKRVVASTPDDSTSPTPSPEPTDSGSDS